MSLVQFSHSVMSDSETQWTEALQASLSITNSRSLLKLMAIESVMPSNHLILCPPLLLLPSIFPSIGVFFFFFNFTILYWFCHISTRIRHQYTCAPHPFLMSWLLSGGQSIRASASASVLPMNIQDFLYD